MSSQKTLELRMIDFITGINSLYSETLRPMIYDITNSLEADRAPIFSKHECDEDFPEKEETSRVQQGKGEGVDAILIC